MLEEDKHIESFKKKDFDIFFEEIAVKYSLSSEDISHIFLKVLEDIFNCSLMAMEQEGNYGYFKYKNGEFKKISFSPRIRAKLKQNFDYMLLKKSIEYKINTAKKFLKANRVFNGTVVKREGDFFVVSTIFGIAKLPINLIPKTELEKLYINSTHLVMVHSYKNNGLVLITMKNSFIDLHIISKLLPSCKVTKVNRYYGVRIKIYVERKLSKIEFDSIKLFFSEKIQYVITKKEEKIS